MKGRYVNTTIRNKKKLELIQNIIDKILPVPKKITNKTKEVTMKWANKCRFV